MKVRLVPEGYESNPSFFEYIEMDARPMVGDIIICEKFENRVLDDCGILMNLVNKVYYNADWKLWIVRLGERDEQDHNGRKHYDNR